MKIEREYVLKRTGETFKVEIEIDIEAVAQTVAARAMHNRSGKGTALHGDVTARVTDRRIILRTVADLKGAQPGTYTVTGDAAAELAAQTARQLGAMVPTLTRCKADRDGDCSASGCPQLRDNEPHTSGRHCPIDTQGEDE